LNVFLRQHTGVTYFQKWSSFLAHPVQAVPGLVTIGRQNLWGVGHPNLKFWDVLTPTTPRVAASLAGRTVISKTMA